MGRIKEIDVAKGIAIILVVVGHICARDVPPGNAWYAVLRDVIYAFHMPFFFFLSGITSFHAFARIKNAEQYRKFVKGKFFFFGKHFLFLATLVFAGKYIFQNFMYVDNGVDSIFDYFIVFIKPTSSFSVFLWFIYTLVIFYAITPPLLKVFGNRDLPVVLIGLAAHLFVVSDLVEVTTLFTINRVLYFFIFYFLGYLTGKHYEFFIGQVKKWGIVTTGAFLASLVVYETCDINLSNFLCIPALMWLAYGLKNIQVLNYVGKESYYIYMYNTIFIGLAKAILFFVVFWGGNAFFLFFVVLGASGVFGPIALHRLADKLKSGYAAKRAAHS